MQRGCNDMDQQANMPWQVSNTIVFPLMWFIDFHRQFPDQDDQ